MHSASLYEEWGKNKVNTTYFLYYKNCEINVSQVFWITPEKILFKDLLRVPTSNIGQIAPINLGKIIFQKISEGLQERPTIGKN